MRTVINPVFPVEAIGSVDELMAIAVGMEHEAAARYEQLAARMAQRGDGEMRDLFLRMAALERDHESGLARWAARERRPTPVAAEFGWPMPETFDPADADGLTPYRALGIAVRNEERAFTFYAYLAAEAEDHAVQRRAEALAKEELEHVHQLRVLRRKAFHMSRDAATTLRRARNIAELTAISAALDWGTRQVVDCAADALRREGDTQCAALAATAAPRAIANSNPASRAVEGARSAGLLVPGALTSDGALALALRDADEVADAYMAIAEQATDEEVLGCAQALAERSVGHAALLRTMIEERARRMRP